MPAFTRRIPWIVGVATAILVVPGCTRGGSEASAGGEVVRDTAVAGSVRVTADEVEGRVEAALRADSTLAAFLLDADDERGRIVIEGVVSTEAQKARAALARYVERRQQAEALGEHGLAVALDDVIADETRHCDELQLVLDGWPEHATELGVAAGAPADTTRGSPAVPHDRPAAGRSTVEHGRSHGKGDGGVSRESPASR